MEGHAIQDLGETTTPGEVAVASAEAGARLRQGHGGQALSAIRSNLETTRARRLAVALAEWRCPVCAGHQPLVYCTRGDVRYVQCAECGATDKVVAG